MRRALPRPGGERPILVRVRRSWGFLAVALTLTGCAVESAASADGPAKEELRKKALRVANVLYAPQGRSVTDVGRRAATLDGVEVLTADGRRGDIHLVLRIQASAGDGRWGENGVRTVRGCFELQLNDDMEYDTEPPVVDCPDNAPLSFAPLPQAPALPSEERLRRALPKVPPEGTVREGDVRAAVAAMDLHPRLGVMYASRGGVVGVTIVAASGGMDPSECVLGRVAPGETKVSTPSRVQRMPGEGGCSPFNAINQLPPPH